IRRLAELAGPGDIKVNDSIFRLVRRALAIAPTDSSLKALLPLVTAKVVVRTTPPGASVYRTRYDDSTGWTLIARTPSDSVVVPNANTGTCPSFATDMRCRGSRRWPRSRIGRVVLAPRHGKAARRLGARKTFQSEESAGTKRTRTRSSPARCCPPSFIGRER